MNAFSNYIVLLVATPALIVLSRYLANKIGLVDRPNVRKIHSVPVPLVGGLVIYLMSLLIVLVTVESYSFAFYLIFVSALIVVIGLIDDLRDISALWRFLIQITSSLLLIYLTNVQIYSFGYLLYSNWDFNLGMMSIPVTVFGVVGVINALNMSDGIDGLASLMFALPVFVMALLLQEKGMDSQWLFMILFVVVIFVFFNKSKKYKIFLGDNGSMFMGFLLAWLLVNFSQNFEGGSTLIKPVTALYLVGLPVYDTIYVMLRRILSGVSPFKPDKTHLHHLFLALGLSQTKALFAMVGVACILISLGVIFLKLGVSEYIQFYVFVFLSALYYQILKKVWIKVVGK